MRPGRCAGVSCFRNTSSPHRRGQANLRQNKQVCEGVGIVNNEECKSNSVTYASLLQARFCRLVRIRLLLSQEVLLGQTLDNLQVGGLLQIIPPRLALDAASGNSDARRELSLEILQNCATWQAGRQPHADNRTDWN
jgi:hypothetical protein